jgi:hypothetical protein
MQIDNGGATVLKPHAKNFGFDKEMVDMNTNLTPTFQLIVVKSIFHLFCLFLFLP